MMVGDNPALPKMPEKPTILDFFRLRFCKLAVNHMLQSARNARKAGHDEKIVLACLLHDVALGGLIRADHGYWGAQMIAPYVDEEVAWAVKHHQALRYFADPAVNYEYPVAYVRFWGADYKIPDYLTARLRSRATSIAGTAAHARSRCSISILSRRTSTEIDPNEFEDVVGRHFQAAGGRPRLRHFAGRPYVAHHDLADEFSLTLQFPHLWWRCGERSEPE